MQISVRRSGGFAGLTEQLATVDTETLEPARRRSVEEAVRDSDFFHLAAVIAGGTTGADLYRYEVSITDAGRSHTVAYGDSDDPETAPVRRLVETVTQRGP